MGRERAASAVFRVLWLPSRVFLLTFLRYTPFFCAYMHKTPRARQVISGRLLTFHASGFWPTARKAPL